jgi:hypothetical protein
MGKGKVKGSPKKKQRTEGKVHPFPSEKEKESDMSFKQDNEQILQLEQVLKIAK